MALSPNDRMAYGARADAAQIDEGLRKFMLGIYNHMGTGLAISGLVAMVSSMSLEFMQLIHGTPLKWVVMLAPLGMLFLMAGRAQAWSAGTLTTLYYVFTAIMGLSLSYIFLAYTAESVAKTFFITAAAFAGLSLYGYTTKRSLSGMGSFMVMGLIGLIIASVVNIFLASSMLGFIISVAGVLIFAGLTAWDTQRLKESYIEGMHEESAAKISVFGAMSLYINFINMFQFLLMFLGDRE